MPAGGVGSVTRNELNAAIAIAYGWQRLGRSLKKIRMPRHLTIASSRRLSNSDTFSHEPEMLE
jgi:hypothetical protein